MGMKCTDAEEQYRKFKDLKREDVAMLKEWLSLQPHIPPMTELEIILFLHSCYYSNEAAKKTIDNFFTCRRHCPEFFSNKNPFSKEIIQTVRTVSITPLPKLTPEGYLIIYVRLIDPNPDEYYINLHLRLFDMKLSLLQREIGCVNGYVMVCDQTGGTLTHLLKVTLPTLKKMMFYIQEAIPIRLKQLYFVHPVNFVDKILNLIKPLLKKELQEMIYVLPGDTIFKRIPLELLPEEIGGTLGPLQTFNENTLKILQENADFFAKDEKRMADENKRPGKPKNAGDLFGVEGTFKKLDID